MRAQALNPSQHGAHGGNRTQGSYPYQGHVPGSAEPLLSPQTLKHGAHGGNRTRGLILTKDVLYH